MDMNSTWIPWPRGQTPVEEFYVEVLPKRHSCGLAVRAEQEAGECFCGPHPSSSDLQRPDTPPWPIFEYVRTLPGHSVGCEGSPKFHGNGLPAKF